MIQTVSHHAHDPQCGCGILVYLFSLVFFLCGCICSSSVYSLDETKVCLLRALQLFSKKEPYPNSTFLADWQSSVPLGMHVSTSILRGHALCETNNALEALARSATGSLSLGRENSKNNDDATKVWKYYPLTSLSPLIKTRFQQLFDHRTRWTLNDISAYVQDLCAPGQTLEQLLLKHARPVSSMEQGVKTIVYTKR
jgi:hypothetical protein